MPNNIIPIILKSIFKAWVSRKSQAILLGVSILLLLGSAFATFLNTNQLIKHNSWVNHTYEVNKNLENIYSNINAIAASLRGYLLTGNTTFVSNLKSHELEMLQHYDEALLLTKDNVIQQARLKQLKTLIDTRLEMVQDRLKLRRENKIDAVKDAVNTLSGENLTNQIRELVKVLQIEEDRLLIKRQQDAQQSSNRMYFTLSIAVLAALSIIIILFVRLKIQITQHERDAILLKQYKSIVESSNDAIISISMDGIIQSLNKGAEIMYGYTAKEVIGSPVRTLIPSNHIDEEAVILQRITNNERVEHFETKRMHKDGHLIDISATISSVLDRKGKVIAASEIARDISERKFAEAEIKKLAFNDALTSLPNRRLLNDRLKQRIATNKRSNTYSALMFLDLDNFKSLNDTHGHEVGDMLLMEAANRLTSCIREMDTVARFGGDEFVVMLGELDESKAVSTTQAAVVAEKIRAALAEPYQFTVSHEGKANTTVEHCCTGSIGVMVFNCSEGSQEDIMKWADVAMYEAKDGGRNQIRFYGEKG